MSVLAAKRRESKLEPIIFSEDLHNMLVDLMHRDFGIKNVDDFVRIQFAHGVFKTEDFVYYRDQLARRKKNINDYASRLTATLRGAYYRYPVNLHEWEIRRDLLNEAITICRMIEGELQKVVDVFKVDVNEFKTEIAAIYREIDMIKRWRQRDNKIKSSLEAKAVSN